MAWLLRYVNSFQEALFAQDWLARSPSYTSLIDGPAFVDYMLLVELTKNPDGYRGSTYMHKDRGGPLAMGPAWDYNEAMGQCCGYPIEGWQNGGASGPGIAGGSAISPEGGTGWLMTLLHLVSAVSHATVTAPLSLRHGRLQGGGS